MKFITFDTETTGTDCEVDRLVELAGVCRGFEHFSTFVNPERDIPPEARAIHHIGPEDFNEETPCEDVAFEDMFIHFLAQPGDHILVAHNAKFDKGFVNRIDPYTQRQYICTMRCAWMSWPDAPGYSNQVLRYWLDLKLDLPEGLFPHRALYDCIVTQGILERLLEKHPVKTLLDWSNNPVLMPKVPYGKHKGKTWDQVDYGYLKWALGPTGPQDDEDFIYTARHWKQRMFK